MTTLILTLVVLAAQGALLIAATAQAAATDRVYKATLELAGLMGEELGKTHAHIKALHEELAGSEEALE